MPTIVPISDLRDYNKVVALVEPGNPVYLTRNGRDEYVMMPAAEYKRGAARAEIFRLLRESEDSVAKYGTISAEEVFSGLAAKWGKKA